MDRQKEIKIKTPYGLKNWTYIKRLMDQDSQNIELKDSKEDFDITINGSTINTRVLR